MHSEVFGGTGLGDRWSFGWRNWSLDKWLPTITGWKQKSPYAWNFSILETNKQKNIPSGAEDKYSTTQLTHSEVSSVLATVFILTLCRFVHCVQSCSGPNFSWMSAWPIRNNKELNHYSTSLVSMISNRWVIFYIYSQIMVVVNASIWLVNSRCSKSHRTPVNSHRILVNSHRTFIAQSMRPLLWPYIVSSMYMDYVWTNVLMYVNTWDVQPGGPCVSKLRWSLGLSV